MYYKLILENGHVGTGKSLETVRYLSGESDAGVCALTCMLPGIKDRTTEGAGVKLAQAVTCEEYIEAMRPAARDPLLNMGRKNRGSKREKEKLFH